MPHEHCEQPYQRHAQLHREAFLPWLAWQTLALPLSSNRKDRFERRVPVEYFVVIVENISSSELSNETRS